MTLFSFDITPESLQREKTQSTMLIEILPGWSLGLIYVSYFILITIAVVTGTFVPEVWEKNTVSSFYCSSNSTNGIFDNSTCFGSDLGRGDIWKGEIQNLTKLNQELRISAKLENRLNAVVGLTKTYDFLITMGGNVRDSKTWDLIISTNTTRTISCEQGERYCDTINLVFQPYLSYNNYNISVQITNLGGYEFVGDILFTFEYVNQSYTLFELWVRFCGLICAFLSLTVLTFLLRKYSWKLWKTEQKWTAILLFGVMAFDNPLFPMELLVKGWFFPMIDELFIISFSVLLLFFFVVMLDSIRLKAETVQYGIRFYNIFKTILIVAIWISCILVWGWIEFHAISDNTFTSAFDVPYSRICFYILIGLFCVYLFYLLYIGIRSVVLLLEGSKLRKRIQFFLFFTLLVIFLAISSAIFTIYLPTLRHASIFLVSIALVNLYTLVLAIFYIPWGNSYEMIVEEEDEDFKETPNDIPMEVIEEEDSIVADVKKESDDSDIIKLQNLE